MSFNLNQDKCYIMGILNVTPDSFFDGGKYLTLDKIMFRVDKMIAEGTDIIDIGGESSRPGSLRISAQEELDRVFPVVSKIRENFDIPLSIDSMKSDVISYSRGIAKFNAKASIENELVCSANINLVLPKEINKYKIF